MSEEQNKQTNRDHLREEFGWTPAEIAHRREQQKEFDNPSPRADGTPVLPGDQDFPMHSEKTIGQYLRERAEIEPNHEFMVYPDRDLRWTYAEFDERTDNLARGMLYIGMRPGDHLGVWARNVPDWVTFMYACAKIGVVMVTMNPVFKSHELDYVLKQSDMKALCIIDSFRDIDYKEIVRELIPESLTQQRGYLNTEEYPFLKNLIYMGPEKHRGFYSVPELLLLGQHVAEEELYEVTKSFDNNDVVMMQYTSGTTGFPKGVMLTHRNILNDGFFIGEGMKLTPNDRVCLPVPYFHCFGCVLGIMAILTHRATIVGVESFDAEMVLRAIDREKATAVYGVPTMYIAELNHPNFSQYDMSSLRTGIMAGSPCPPATMAEVIEKMNMKDITICYGLTETSPVFTQTSVDDDIDHKCHTVGRKHPPVSVKVVDPNDGHECAPGEHGELCCKGYNVMKGYYKMPDKTAEAIDADGYLHSGDMGTVDEDGYYRVTGRIKDMIIRGGENIYPLEVENFLLTMPGVLDAQVVGIPDEKLGEIVGAFIRTRPGFEDMTEEDVRAYAIPRIARFKVPKRVFFVDEFPMNPAKKVQKYKLREMAKELTDRVNQTVFADEEALRASQEDDSKGGMFREH
ncbi:AMP-binding protein [Denitrobacterium detoxificans]|uniref:Fatty-acyl-CoA synthase n=1 Tax=Denitrobacterium detoxificans TaxID=79604 RepID=A0A1H8RTA1_9ACTN|nr:AMP-binding protein [Denitrobacterium detoxificans]SEO69507.1 fatty-acyl-CoA synthase [Denitrobacterium detoxificans]